MRPAEWNLRTFTVDEDHRMIEAGILHSGEKVELLEGYLVRKATSTPPVVFSMHTAWKTLHGLLSNDWLLRFQGPITLATSDPEPDVAIVRGTSRTYTTRHPDPAEVALVAEVAEASLAIDRGFKAPLYGEAGIPVYWLLNVIDNEVEVYTQTPTGGYGPPLVLTPGQQLPLVLGGVHLGDIPVADLFV